MTRAEFEAKYGFKAPVSSYTSTTQAVAPVKMTRAAYASRYGAVPEGHEGTSILSDVFNPQAFKDVWTKAAQDIASAKSTNMDPYQKVNTAIVQGGLAPFRSVSSGVSESSVGKAVSEAIDVPKRLESFGNLITPESAKDIIGQYALKTVQGYENMSAEEQQTQRNRLGVAEALSYFLGGSTKVPKKVGLPNAETVTNAVATPKTPPIKVDAFAEGKSLRSNIQAIAGEKFTEPQFKASVSRIASEPVYTKTANQPKDFLKGTAIRTKNVVQQYDGYFKDAEIALNDIKAEPPLSQVGSDIGDSFQSVIKMRSNVGKSLEEEVKKWGKLRVSVEEAVKNTVQELDDSGLSFNPRTRQLTSFQGSKFVPQEVDMLSGFLQRVQALGDAPTVRDINNFISRARTEMAFTKGETGVLGTTNAERIINGTIANLKESLNPEKNGIAQLRPYWKANSAYSDLSNFVEEGSGYLGKITQSGDFAKDASLAKSSVQSILNNGKKDWLLRLEALTDYKALDNSVLALQAMKDAGDYRGASLLQAIRDQGIPTSKAGFVGALIDKTVDVGKRAVLGKPSEQTRAYLKTLVKPTKSVLKTDLKVPDKALIASSTIPKTKKLASLESKIAKNVAEQKVAIKAKDYVLVAKLKQIYSTLVTKLKAEIKLIKDSMSDQSGHASLGNAPKANAFRVRELEDFITRQEKARDALLAKGLSPSNASVSKLEKTIKEATQRRNKLQG